MGALPANARLFTADETAMYTIIKPVVGILAVQAWLVDFEHKLPKRFFFYRFMQALEMVMICNTFHAYDTVWQQFVVTAMDTPGTGVYATLAYGHHEITSIISQQSKEIIPYLKRFIDDMIGIWCGLDGEWEVFKASLNVFGKLEWICSERLTSVLVLDN
jgi:hypothetical protein